MIPITLREISKADIEALIGNARESKTLEFKKEMPAKTNEEKLKLLRAVSSLANTTGGDLLIGVQERGGIADAIAGMAAANADSEILRFNCILATQIEPRVPGVEFTPSIAARKGAFLYCACGEAGLRLTVSSSTIPSTAETPRETIR